MFRQAILILVMFVPLAGALATGVPLPVTLVMGALIVIAFTIAFSRPRQEG